MSDWQVDICPSGILSALYSFQSSMSDSQNRWQLASKEPCGPGLGDQQQETESQKQNTLSQVPTHRLFDLFPHSIDALYQIKDTVQSTSLTKIIQCCTTDKKALSYLKELNASEIKESILYHIVEDLQLQKTRRTIGQSSTQQEVRQAITTELSKEQIKEVVQDYLSQLVQKVSTYLRKNQNQKFVYKFIHFQWTSTIVQLFLNALHHQAYQPESQTIESAEEKAKQNLKYRSEAKQIDQKIVHKAKIVSNDVICLLNQVDDKTVARKLYLSFSSLSQEFSTKESELQSSKRQTQELAALLSHQMKIIQEINNQNNVLHNQIKANCSQFQNLKSRCEALERQLQSTVKTLASIQEENKRSYYLNPLWEKSKLQEKYMTEIIQLQSDIYLERSQVKALVDLVVDQIKATHKAFYDLGSSSYFVSKFDCGLYKKLKLLKAFDGVNLDDWLVLREESLLEDSDYTHDMHKSTISTYSSIEMDHKHQLLAEESFENFNQNND